MSLTALTGQLTAAVAIGLGTGFASSGSTTEALTELRVALATPTVNFVPIYSETVKQSRKAQVSTSMIISQSEGTKQYITDNIAPFPRVWTIDGYLKMLLPYVESTAWVKPTLLLQKAVLDAAQISRLAVPFKTVDGEIVDVLISELNIEEKATINNSCRIHIVVQEIPALMAEDGGLGALSKSVTTKSALASIPNMMSSYIGVATVAATVTVAATGFSTIVKENVDKIEENLA